MGEKREGVEDTLVENMVLSPSNVSVRKWRKAARKGQSSNTMVGITSHMKKIIEACYIAKKKNREGNPSPNGRGQKGKGLRKKSPTRKEGSGAKRKLMLRERDDGISEKKFKSAKYFKDEDFLSVKLKPGASHVWRSIVWGRELLLKGIKGKVGDGKSIKAFVDPWIPRPTSFLLVTTTGNNNSLVADFLLDDGMGWEIRKLDQIFLNIDRDAILFILLSLRSLADKILWHYDKKGTYKVKSVYKVALQESVSEACLDPSIPQRWWSKLWSLNIPPKVKNFV
ncbi:hypothetical protein LWI28_026934 [Acer negundo]|uniref:Uncharacterized protein n=1 Tax=Acer negundo TaxID=4023 RepID=A0AAD5NKL2_ACENE|nr:hypothetical protein LWI28_026934 [Acer negundo]